MKPILALAIILALAGCSAADKQPKHGKHSEADRAAALASAAEANATDAGDNADLAMPATVPASYEQFPAAVRASIYHRDLLNQKCGGRFRTKAAGACEARDAVDKELLAKGWCFGGADDPASQHWVLCAQDYPGGEGYIASPKDDALETQ